MSDVEQLVRKALRHHEAEVPVPDPSEARPVSVRARRRQVLNTVGAGLVALALALGAMTGVGALLRADPRRPAIEPTPTPTASPLVPVTFPPAGVDPSTPVTGEVVIRFSAEDVTEVSLPEADRWERIAINVYADGRVIWSRCGDVLDTLGADADVQAYVGCVPSSIPEASAALSTGWVQQRLTPEGVEFLRSELLATGLFERGFESVTPNSTDLLDWLSIDVLDGDRMVNVRADYQVVDLNPPTPNELASLEHMQEIFLDLEAWLPDSAWADEQITAFVPSSYSFWFKRGSVNALLRDAPSVEVVRALEPQDLPTPADELLTRGRCGVVTLAEARAIVDGFEAVGISRSPEMSSADIIAVLAIDTEPGAAVYFEPNLPGSSSSC